MWSTPWQWWHLMSEECEVILETAGDVVIFAGVEEGEAHVALFEVTAGAREEGAPVLDVGSRGVNAVAPLLVDC
jgi:hypothetical protein